MIARALKFVRHDRVEDHFRQGWMISFPNAPMHHHVYSIEMKWICPCPVPGGFGKSSINRVPAASQTEDAHVDNRRQQPA
jgi:hypothetical protein